MPGMSLLTISDLSLSVAGRSLLERADLIVEPGQRGGIGGRNGAGKSTLLRAIAGEVAPDGGDIRLASRARLTQVRQEAPEGSANLVETVLAGDAQRLRLLREADHAEPLRLAEIHERLLAIDADAAPS